MIKNIPEGEKVIGIKSIVKGIKNGEIEKVIVSNNCPEKIKNKISVETVVFDGNQIKLGTALGKPFPIAAIGVKSGSDESKTENE